MREQRRFPDPLLMPDLPHGMASSSVRPGEALLGRRAAVTSGLGGCLLPTDAPPQHKVICRVQSQPSITVKVSITFSSVGFHPAFAVFWVRPAYLAFPSNPASLGYAEALRGVVSNGGGVPGLGHATSHSSGSGCASTGA